MITIIVLLILVAVSIATLTGENGILTKANTAKEKTEIEEAKEQAKLDIGAYIEDQTEKGQSTELNDSIIQKILTGKDYVKDKPGESSFKTKENEYEILYSELYQKTIKKISFKITCPEGNEEYGGTYEVEEGTTWAEFLSTHNSDKTAESRMVV